MSHELDLVLPEDAHFIVCEPVVLRVLGHGEAKSLAYDIVEWYCQEVSPEKHQAHAKDSVELSPLCLLLEDFVHLHGLSPFSYLQWQRFLLVLYLDFTLLFFIDLHSVVELDAINLLKSLRTIPLLDERLAIM